MEQLQQLLKKYSQFVQPATRQREHRLLSLGPLSLNLTVGHPHGVPAGSIIQVVGQPSHGKTTLVLDICAAYHQRYPEDFVLFVDFERTLDVSYARVCGVDIDRLLVARPDTAELGMKIIEDLIRDGGIRLVVVDSVPLALPSNELERDFTDPQKVASAAQIITRFCTRNVGLLDTKDATVILINQFRKNLSGYGGNDVPFGGMALQYASSIILQVKRTETKPNGFTMEVTVAKSKVGTPKGRAVLFLEYGQGIDHDLDILTLAVEYGIVSRRGAWYEYTTYKAQGIEQTLQTFPLEEIRERIIEVYESRKQQQ